MINPTVAEILFASNGFVLLVQTFTKRLEQMAGLTLIEAALIDFRYQ